MNGKKKVDTETLTDEGNLKNCHKHQPTLI